MASAQARVGGMALVGPVFIPAGLGAVAYTAWKVQWRIVLREFFSGPGRNTRVLLLLFALLNWKNMPFAWTIRVFNAIIYHTFIRRPPILGPKALFRPMISQSHAPILEIDYNIHKSNSTYFADLDVSRSHLISYLCRPGLRKITYNGKHRVVKDPSGKTVPGDLGIMLGGVACSFRREIPAYKPYEMWSRILTWDRKWIYIVTHFVPKGSVRPASWLDPKFKKVRTRSKGEGAKEEDWPSKVYASAISKYVFKVGRFTVHPSIVLEESHLLPPRPGGWRGGADEMGEQSDIGDGPDGEDWNWRRIERQRREGMQLAAGFGNLDNLQGLFDGGDGGALGRFGLG